jgi:hypothetical protein
VAEDAEVDVRNAVGGDAESVCYAPGRIELDAMALPVVEGKRVDFEPLPASPGETRRRVETAAK